MGLRRSTTVFSDHEASTVPDPRGEFLELPTFSQSEVLPARRHHRQAFQETLTPLLGFSSTIITWLMVRSETPCRRWGVRGGKHALFRMTIRLEFVESGWNQLDPASVSVASRFVSTPVDASTVAAPFEPEAVSGVSLAKYSGISTPATSRITCIIGGNVRDIF